MKNWKQAIEKCKEHLIALGTSNMVIGGSHALLLHGLDIGRDTDDFDVVIYEPTMDQLKYLADKIHTGEMKESIEESSDNTRSCKVECNGATIDFLIERNTCMPADLLLVHHSGITLFVQSVYRVIDAKRSYTNEDGMFRQKDVDDCKLLKNANFNL